MEEKEGKSDEAAGENLHFSEKIGEGEKNMEFKRMCPILSPYLHQNVMTVIGGRNGGAFGAFCWRRINNNDNKKNYKLVDGKKDNILTLTP